MNVSVSMITGAEVESEHTTCALWSTVTPKFAAFCAHMRIGVVDVSACHCCGWAWLGLALACSRIRPRRHEISTCGNCCDSSSSPSSISLHINQQVLGKNSTLVHHEFRECDHQAACYGTLVFSPLTASSLIEISTSLVANLCAILVWEGPTYNDAYICDNAT